MKLPWYYQLAVVGTSLASVVLSVMISVNASNRAIDSDRRARAEAAKDSRAVSCVLIIAQDAVYSETPPTTKLGRDVAVAWHDLRTRYCD